MGGDARYDLLEGKDHFATCDEAFTKQRLGWLFGHKKESTGVPQLTDDHEKNIIGIFTIDGRLAGSDATGLLIIRYDDGTATKVVR